VSAGMVILVLGVGSYLVRLLPVLAGARITSRVERVLAAAGTAALTALVAGDVATADSAGATVAATAAVAIGVVVAHRGGSMIRVLLVGVPVYVVVLALVG
jgi:branched-subunit amino acid transport protein